MNGQLWQECSHRGCGTEPVCADCEYCEDHCECARRKSDQEQIEEFEAAHPGFLERLAIHMEQGAMERDGKGEGDND